MLVGVRLNEKHSNEGIYIKPIVSLNLIYPIVLPHTKLPSNESDDATQHYLYIFASARFTKVVKRVSFQQRV